MPDTPEDEVVMLAVAINDAQIEPSEIQPGRDLRIVARRILRGRGQIGYTLDDPLMVAAKAVIAAWETRPYSGETVKQSVIDLQAAIDAMEPHDA